MVRQVGGASSHPDQGSLHFLFSRFFFFLFYCIGTQTDKGEGGELVQKKIQHKKTDQNHLFTRTNGILYDCILAPSSWQKRKPSCWVLLVGGATAPGRAPRMVLFPKESIEGAREGAKPIFHMSTPASPEQRSICLDPMRRMRRDEKSREEQPPSLLLNSGAYRESRPNTHTRPSPSRTRLFSSAH